MSDVRVSRWAGGFGLAGFVVFLVAMPLYFGGTAAPVQDTGRYSHYVASTSTAIIVRTSIADPLIVMGLLVVLAGFRELVRRARPEYGGLATLVFGVGVLLVAIELVVAPSILGGTDPTAFWSASGYVTFIPQVAMLLWFLVASISMLRRGKAAV